jgi:asparagine synthase (glutamine-hydrolysing)
MSVQAGIWNFDGRPVDRKLLVDISESLKHKGPDGENWHLDGSVALLYRPFHTTAESRREKQPYLSQRGFIVTWDGRLDNRDEIILEVNSDLEANPTDIAVVAAAFDRWETDCFRRFIGDWAISVWEPQSRGLLFAVDYMAIRHIFYYLKNDRIWWSTDISPLVSLSSDKFHIDEDYIAGYFAHDPDAHLTPYREIREVPPGQFVHTRNGNVSVNRYWRFNSQSAIRYRTDEGYEEHFRHVFRQSVRRRLRSDTPILAELSGGLDSSSIVCMADDVVAKDPTSGVAVDTLSYYDKSEPDGDDWLYFPKIEAKRGRAGIHIDASQFDNVSILTEASNFEPTPASRTLHPLLDGKLAEVVEKGGYRVLFSGIGGDEFLGGVPDPRELLADLILSLSMRSLARELIAWSLVKRKPWIQLLLQSARTCLPVQLRRYVSKEAKVEPWIEKEFARRTNIATLQLDVREHFGLCLPTRRSCISGVFFMANRLAKWTSPSATCIDTRYPYLDRDLVEFVLSTPATQFLRPGERRSLMRRSLTALVPAEILSRRTKQVGARTVAMAVSQKADALRTAFRFPLSSSLGYVNRDRFLDALNATANGKEVNTMRLLRTISLELWLQDMATRSLFHMPPPIPAFEIEGKEGTGCAPRVTHPRAIHPNERPSESTRQSAPAISKTSASRAVNSEKGGQNHELQET